QRFRDAAVLRDRQSAQLLSADEEFSGLWADRQCRRRAGAELRDLLRHAGDPLPQLYRSASGLDLGADRFLRRREGDVLSGVGGAEKRDWLRPVIAGLQPAPASPQTPVVSQIREKSNRRPGRSNLPQPLEPFAKPLNP